MYELEEHEISAVETVPKLLARAHEDSLVPDLMRRMRFAEVPSTMISLGYIYDT